MTKRVDEENQGKAGRPTVVTQEAINKLEMAFSLGCSDNEACLFADISRQALYRYQRAHPEFIERKELLKDKLVFKARSVVANALNSGDSDIAKWYLERKRKDEFSTKQNVDMFNIQTEVKPDIDVILELRKKLESDE